MKRQVLLFGIVFLFCIVGVLASQPYPVSNPDLMDYVYPLDNTEGTSFLDLLGGTNGSSIGNVDADWVAGQTNFSNAFRSDGVDNILMTQLNDWYNGEELSVSVWIKMNSALPIGGNYKYFFGHTDVVGGQLRVAIDEDRIIVLIGDGAGIQYQQYNGAEDNFTIGRWNHLLLNIRRQLTAVGRYDLWINGNNQTAFASVTNVIVNKSMNASLLFGGKNASGTLQEFVNATFDDIVIGKFLSNSQIQTRNLGNYTVDVTPPNITQINFTSDGGWICPAYPLLCNETTDLSPSFTLTVNENADTCRGSTVDENLVDMPFNGTGAGTEWGVTFTVGSIPFGYNTLYFACNDTLGNNYTTPLPNASKVNISIFSISIESIVLNSTLGTNLVTENLTAYPINVTPSNAKIIYDWKLNGVSFALFNMPFDGGTLVEGNTKVKDYSDNRNNGTLGNGTPITEPTYNSSSGYDGAGAYEFDGIDDFINTTDKPYLNLTSGNFTLSAWISSRQVDAPTDLGIIDKGYNGSGSGGYFLMHGGTSNSIRCGIFNGSTYFLADGVTPLSNNTWFYAVCVYDGINISTYINGTLEATTVVENVGSTSESMVVGARASGLQGFNGTVDEVRIYNHSLSPEQIDALYRNNTDLIVSDETNIGDVWKACATPNNDVYEGDEVCSNDLTVLAADTCTYSNGNWTVSCSDNCSITENVDVGGNDIFITGLGLFISNATISNYSLLKIVGLDNSNICVVKCESDGRACFV